MINLWTALETITGSMGPKSIRSRVADRIAPIIAYRRIDKIATYLALSIHATVSRDGRGLIVICCLLQMTTSSHPMMFYAVTGKKKNDSIMYLFNRCSVSPLLLNRLFSVWQEFHEPRSLAKSIARSKARVEWQIARIYRARNLLVHRGEQSPYMETAAERTLLCILGNQPRAARPARSTYLDGRHRTGSSGPEVRVLTRSVPEAERRGDYVFRPPATEDTGCRLPCLGHTCLQLTLSAKGSGKHSVALISANSCAPTAGASLRNRWRRMNPRTTALYDRRDDEVAVDEVERILI